jgi:single-strand DNA-binding protein
MNKIIVVGNLGRDPEMRYMTTGEPVTTFSIADSRRYTTAAGEKKQVTEWFNVTAWGPKGELCNQYLEKGKQVLVEGRLKVRSYEGRDGQRRFVNEIVLTDVTFLGSKAGESEPAEDPAEVDTAEIPSEKDGPGQGSDDG